MKIPFPILLCLLIMTGLQTDGAQADHIVKNTQTAPHRGVYEISFQTALNGQNPFFDISLQVIFVRPDSARVVVDGFYDGDNTYRARAYCDTPGQWKWSSVSNWADMNHKTGTFTVNSSSLKGKLRKHPTDPHQFAYDNGEWFLHIGDTGYRYVTDTEPEWKAYIDQAAQAGFTKIRTWFCRGRSDVSALFQEDRMGMNLPYWQEIDRRVAYALNQHPSLILQLIPFGEDTAEIRRYGDGDRASIFTARYAQARFSSFPNIYWCVSNDRDIVSREDKLGKRDIPLSVIHTIGMDMRRREPWGTLLTNHQRRFQGYSFTNAEWSDIITIEDLDQTDGRAVLLYWRWGDDPVILDEDRYECYRNPEHPRYFFRRLMWACLLSGGSAAYGGLRTYEAYDGELKGVQGYADAVNAGKLKDGAHDFQYIHKFFHDTGISLVGMIPADEMAGCDPQQYKCIHDQEKTIVYLQNPDSRNPQKANVANTKPSVSVHLPRGTYTVQWYEPTTGQWLKDEKNSRITGEGEQKFSSPFSGDAILYLKIIKK